MLGIKIAFIFVGLCGLMLLGFAVYFSYKNIIFFTQGESVQGKVTSTFKIRKVRSSQDGVRVEFLTKDGNKIIAETSISGNYNKDDIVNIYYMPKQPNEILIVEYFGNWWLIILLLLFATLFIRIGIGGLKI